MEGSTDDDIKRITNRQKCNIDSRRWRRCIETAFSGYGTYSGADVTMVKYAPMGDPVELRIHSYELTLRLADAEKIEITDVRDEIKIKNQIPKEKIDHPGLGEGGKYHEKADENPLPDGTTLTFALAGNQNCGKTTLFNQLTGSNQHVGNFRE